LGSPAHFRKFLPGDKDDLNVRNACLEVKIPRQKTSKFAQTTGKHKENQGDIFLKDIKTRKICVMDKILSRQYE